MFAFRVALLSMALVAVSGVAFAQAGGTSTEETACRSDVRRFCYKVKDPNNTNAFLECLQANRARLSRACRAVLENHGV